MKNVIRKELIVKRKKMSKKEVLEKSRLLKKRLFEIDEFKQASTILFYVSYGNEVYTHDMIKESISKGRHIVVPISDKENRRLILSEFGEWNNLEPGSYGILEPRKDKMKEIPVGKVDLIIVPGVGFDEKGNRLGHGKGYYDNLLRNSTKALHIGLAFEFQLVDEIPVEDHDMKVDKIVTEGRIINCTDAM